jgi:hypothetical protein
MFKAVCKLGLEGIVSKKLNAPVSIRAIEKLDQGQKSELTSRNSCYRWNILIKYRVPVGERGNKSQVTVCMEWRQWVLCRSPSY